MSQQKSSNLKFIIGVILILIGALVCFNLFLLLIGIPIFLVGAILVLISKKSVLTKIITISIPIILWWVGFAALGYFVNKKTPIAVVVPTEFKGQLRVVYGEKGGVVPKEVDGRMELEIPDNGILIIKPYLESGLDDIKYYCKDANGQRYEISAMKNAGDKSVKRPAVYFEGTGSSTSNDPEKAPSLDYLYNSFYVFKSDSDKVETQMGESERNELTDYLVKVSREIK